MEDVGGLGVVHVGGDIEMTAPGEEMGANRCTGGGLGLSLGIGWRSLGFGSGWGWFRRNLRKRLWRALRMGGCVVLDRSFRLRTRRAPSHWRESYFRLARSRNTMSSTKYSCRNI